VGKGFNRLIGGMVGCFALLELQRLTGGSSERCGPSEHIRTELRQIANCEIVAAVRGDGMGVLLYEDPALFWSPDFSLPGDCFVSQARDISVVDEIKNCFKSD
jgi:hypothetical protein